MKQFDLMLEEIDSPVDKVPLIVRGLPDFVKEWKLRYMNFNEMQDAQTKVTVTDVDPSVKKMLAVFCNSIEEAATLMNKFVEVGF